MSLTYLLSKADFPHPSKAETDGLLAVGGSLSATILLKAYRQGIFPWYSKGEPILWWSPDPRMVIVPSEVKVSKSMKKILRDKTFRVSYNQNFLGVILACKRVERDGQAGTWITNEMVDAYLYLHRLGHAESVEVWHEDKLVGGLYGINLREQKVFCGESMFSKESNASKVALITLSRKLKKEDYKLIDCQVYTKHLESMGAKEIKREEFLSYLKIKE